MLVPVQVNTSCDICCNISASISKSKSNLYKIEEGDWNTIITCYHCQGEMASIPHTMQMVKSQKKRYSQQSQSSNAPSSGYFNPRDMEKPNRYNSKKMNAIWGMYNKDSVHNFKSMATDAVSAAEFKEQGTEMLFGNQDALQQQQFMQHQFQYQDHQQPDQGYAGQSFTSSIARGGLMGDDGRYLEHSNGSSYLGAPVVGSPGQFTGMMPVGGCNNQPYHGYYTPDSLKGSSGGSNSS